MVTAIVYAGPRFPVTKESCKALTSQTSENSSKNLFLPQMAKASSLLVLLTNITFALIISFT